MRSFNPNWRRFNRTRQQTGKRSDLEVQVASQLDRLGVKYEYEKRKIYFVKPSKARKYTPDFELTNGVIIEAKGLFDTSDRQKHLLIKEQHPQLDIRFVFSNPNQRISKQSRTTYAMWCEKNGFLYARGFVPKEWLEQHHA
ncbi:MAG: hypothetical protein A4E20_01295 [Nitrospira sp. SG-bin2]|uniref:hypothetical protein n=1 Tax=Nitrospira cf. moscoviensis SBR1015 TaxID=96242 RepID=UPI000A0BFCF3|nr:hypothetical protein [Nitrospira cf. moscoviensis SBR1015]OQW34839.1 MAG: hypothetical protein A4E20_01295 [Nitrospira sp. SG-bin2]